MAHARAQLDALSEAVICVLRQVDRLSGVFGVSDPIEILERRLRNVLEEKDDARGLHFFCQIGGNYDDLGIVTLQLSGSGWVLISWSQGEEESELFSVQLRAEDVSKFHGVLLAHPYWSVSPARRARRGDETNIHLRLSDQKAGTYNFMQCWSGDLEQYPVLRQLMRRVSRFIDLVTEEQIPFDALTDLSA